MRLALCNDWYDKKSAVFWNKDGILKAMQVLRDKYGWDVTFFKKHEKTFTWEHDYVHLDFSPDPVATAEKWNPDAYLLFADFSRQISDEIAATGRPFAQAYTGGRFTEHATKPHIVFTESKSYIPWMESVGVRKVVQAFGTNTELFKPMPNPKIFDAFFPATGALWKRHHLFAEAMGPRGLVCGWWQPHEPQCLEVCQQHNTAVLHHQMAESVAYLYNMSKTVLITSSDVGGSQRSVLEAMASNVPVIVMDDSTMTTEYVRDAGVGAIIPPDVQQIRNAVNEWKDKQVNTRDWVLKNYSEWVYADKLKEGIESICTK